MAFVPAVLNFGSLNIDRVVRVERIVAPGETIAGQSLTTFAGGKGANQSVALARAGVEVAHLGHVGEDGQWLLELLAAERVDIQSVRRVPGPSGQAMIQVDAQGQNAIVVLGAANVEFQPAEIDQAIERCAAGTWLLAQNETNAVDHALRVAHERGLRVAFNPAPFDARVPGYPLDAVDLLCLNETEGAALAGSHDPDAIVETLAARWPRCEILLTLGAAGAIYRGPQEHLRAGARAVATLDTTAAGDTFLGYFLAARCRGLALAECLDLAGRAAALCVTRAGAMASIPHWDEVLNFCGRGAI